MSWATHNETTPQAGTATSPFAFDTSGWVVSTRGSATGGARTQGAQQHSDARSSVESAAVGSGVSPARSAFEAAYGAPAPYEGGGMLAGLSPTLLATLAGAGLLLFAALKGADMALFGTKRTNTQVNNATSNFYDQRAVNDAGGGIIGSGNALDASTSYLYDGSDRSVTAVDARDLSSYEADNSIRSEWADYSSVDASTVATWSDYSQRTSTVDASDRSSFSDSRSYALDNSDRSSWADSRSYALDSSDRSTTTTTTNVSGTDPGLVQWAELNAGFLGAAAEEQADVVRFLADAGADTIARLGESATSIYSTSGANQARAWEYTLDKAGDIMTMALEGTARASMQAGELAASAMASYQPADAKAADSLKWVALAAGAGLLLMFMARR